MKIPTDARVISNLESDLHHLSLVFDTDADYPQAAAYYFIRDFLLRTGLIEHGC